MSEQARTVVLTPLQWQHVAATLKWANDPELARLLDRPRAIEAAEHERWFEDLDERTDTLYFAVEEDGRHIGNVWLADIDRRHQRAEVRIVIDPAAAGHGSGSRAIDLIATHAFEAMQLNRVFAYVLAFNPRARRAFEKAGFTLEGRLRMDRAHGNAFVDVYLLGRLKNDSPR